eukprot:1272681-Rhodomonas_salina.1
MLVESVAGVLEWLARPRGMLVESVAGVLEWLAQPGGMLVESVTGVARPTRRHAHRVCGSVD